MERTPYRQFLAWMVWLREQWNRPSRTDTYLMKLEAAVRGIKKLSPGVMKRLQVQFDFKKPVVLTKKQQKEQEAREVEREIRRNLASLGLGRDGKPLSKERKQQKTKRQPRKPQ